MKIIKDEKRILNLHPLVVYFMLSPQDNQEYAESLERLNDYKCFTRNLFKYSIVLRGEGSSAEIPQDLAEEISRYNVMVRLIDDADGNFYYALSRIELSREYPDAFEYSLTNFVSNVCHKDLQHLLENENHYAQDEIMEMRNAFRMALSVRHINPDIPILANACSVKVLPQDFEESKYFRAAESFNDVPGIMDRELLDAIHHFKEGGSNRSTFGKKAMKRVLAVLEDMYNYPDMKRSKEIAQGSVDKTCSQAIYLDHTERLKQIDRDPVISIKIKRIVKKVLKDGRKKKAYGAEFIIDGRAIPVSFGSSDSVLLYICVLLKQNENDRFYPSQIRNYKGMLREIYNEIIYGYSLKNDFDTWWEDGNKGHTIHNARCRCNREIQLALEEEKIPEAYRFCSIQSCSDNEHNSYYQINVPPEHVICDL